MDKKKLDRLFSKSMTRREFLAQVGTALLVLIGVKGLMNHLAGETGGSQSKRSARSGSDYGTSNYGE